VEGGVRLTPAWTALGAALAAGAVLAWWAPTAVLDWQPARVFIEPWRWWTAALVHWSPLHLAANLAGALAVVLLGRAARAGRRATLAWALAWPLAHAPLLARPEVAHYGGLSGALHAGVAVAATALALRGRGARRALALALLAGLAVKVLLERPWGPALVTGGGWDIAVVPLAHAGGAAAGVLLALALCRPVHTARPCPLTASSGSTPPPSRW
jgi:rhomboid family GlyGly-CTERM serine protease